MPLFNLVLVTLGLIACTPAMILAVWSDTAGVSGSAASASNTTSILSVALIPSSLVTAPFDTPLTFTSDTLYPEEGDISTQLDEASYSTLPIDDASLPSLSVMEIDGSEGLSESPVIAPGTVVQSSV